MCERAALREGATRSLPGPDQAACRLLVGLRGPWAIRFATSASLGLLSLQQRAVAARTADARATCCQGQQRRWDADDDHWSG